MNNNHSIRHKLNEADYLVFSASKFNKDPELLKKAGLILINVFDTILEVLLSKINKQSKGITLNKEATLRTISKNYENRFNIYEYNNRNIAIQQFINIKNSKIDYQEHKELLQETVSNLKRLSDKIEKSINKSLYNTNSLMQSEKLLDLAENYAIKYHKGQLRKAQRNKLKLPYVIHPMNVVGLLLHHGWHKRSTLAIGWLHDIIEDTPITHSDLIKKFDKTIADGVLILTRDVKKKEYKQRLAKAPHDVIMIKLCDLLDNMTTMDCLRPKTQKRYIKDSIKFYIPLARQISPSIAEEIQNSIAAYYQRKTMLKPIASTSST